MRNKADKTALSLRKSKGFVHWTQAIFYHNFVGMKKFRNEEEEKMQNMHAIIGVMPLAYLNE